MSDTVEMTKTIQEAWDAALEEAELGLVPEGFRDKLKTVLLAVLEKAHHLTHGRECGWCTEMQAKLRHQIKELP